MATRRHKIGTEKPPTTPLRETGERGAVQSQRRLKKKLSHGIDYHHRQTVNTQISFARHF